MKPLNYRSTGREPYVFKADKADDLFGVHAHLMAMALSAREEILYLLYSSIYEVNEGYSEIEA